MTTCSMSRQVWHRLVVEGIPLLVALRLSHSGSRRGLPKFTTHRLWLPSCHACVSDETAANANYLALPKLYWNMSTTLPAKRRAMSSLNASHFCCFSVSEARTCCSQHGSQKGSQERQAREAGKAGNARNTHTHRHTERSRHRRLRRQRGKRQLALDNTFIHQITAHILQYGKGKHGKANLLSANNS